MAKAAPAAAPATNTVTSTVAGGGSFANQNTAMSNVDPRFRNIKSPPQQAAIRAQAPLPAPLPPSQPAVNPLAALASLLPQTTA